MAGQLLKLRCKQVVERINLQCRHALEYALTARQEGSTFEEVRDCLGIKPGYVKDFPDLVAYLQTLNDALKED